MGTLWQDIRYGVRMLIKHPAFTAVAVLTLALGVGANTAIFSVVNSVLLRSLPYKNPEQLVTLWETNATSRNVHISNPNFLDWREQNNSFEYISAYMGQWGGPSTVRGGSTPERAPSVAVYRDFFNVLGVMPALGRTFSREESQFGTTPVVVVSNGFWRRQLGGDPNLADKELTIDGMTFNVIGVMPPGFSFPPKTDLWISKEQIFKDDSSRTSHNVVGIARLKDGINLEQAQGDMDGVMRHLAEQYPNDLKDKGVNVVSLRDELVGSVRPALLILLAAVGLVLLIACANIANLLLARSMSRHREIAIRAALGAHRFRIIRQLLTESVLLALIGGGLGLLLALWLHDIFISLGPTTIPRLSEVSIDSRVLLFTLGVTLLTSILFGLWPALRVTKLDLQESLKEGSRGTTGGTGVMRNALVVVEVALTLILLIGAGLLAKSFWRLSQVNPGFDPENVLTMQVSLPASDYKEESQTRAFYRELLGHIEATPGVSAAGAINNLPMGGVNINGSFLIEGQPEDKRGSAGFRIVSSGYFSAMNIALVKGRLFTDQDDENSLPVAIISQSTAQATWPGEDPIGKRIRSGMDNRYEVWTTIVGVVGDVRHLGLDRSATAELYVPYAQRPSRAREMNVVARTTGDPASLATAMRGEVQAIDRNLPVNFETMGEVFSKSVANRRFNMLLLAVFAALALALACVGLYGLLSYTVTQNTREIGIRMALGAQGRDVLKLVIVQGMVLTLAGIGFGIAGAFWLTRLMSSLLYGVAATDPMTFAEVALLLLFVALSACYIPARRATKVDPMVALRYE
jgi:putative ABC transport system permease protein